MYTRRREEEGKEEEEGYPPPPLYTLYTTRAIYPPWYTLLTTPPGVHLPLLSGALGVSVAPAVVP